MVKRRQQYHNSNKNQGKAVNEEIGEDKSKYNKFTLSTTDENEIIEKIQENTKLDKDKIKRAIKFKHKDLIYSIEEEIEEAVFAPLPEQLTELSAIAEKISIINGSIILKLG